RASSIEAGRRSRFSGDRNSRSAPLHGKRLSLRQNLPSILIRRRPLMNSFTIRAVQQSDCASVAELYRAVAAVEGGLARTADEITDGYIEHFIQKACDDGLGLVAVLDQSGRIIGEVHAYRLGPWVFAHVLG